MGYIRHKAIVAATQDFSAIGRGDATGDVERFREEMPEEYRKYLVGPVKGINAYDFWCFLPDGSKEGWDYSNEVQEWRERFASLLASTYPSEFVGIAFGADVDDGPYISHT